MLAIATLALPHLAFGGGKHRDLEEAELKRVKSTLKHHHNFYLTWKNYNGQTHLFEEAKMGYAKVVGLLLESGADANAQDNNGQTTLDIAVLGEHSNVVEVLLAVAPR